VAVPIRWACKSPEKAVRKRWFIGILVGIACAGALALAFPALVYKPLGLLRHEASFGGKPTSYWARALKHEGYLGHAPPAGDAGKTLREGGPAAVPVLCQLAEDPDDDLRAEALRVLSFLGPEARDATPALTAAMKKEDHSTRFLLASEALAKIDPPASAEALSAVLCDKTNDARRAWALSELVRLAPQGGEALPALNETALPVLNGILHDRGEDGVLRVQAGRVLWLLKQPAEPVVAALCEVVTADQSPAGVQALDALGEMGPAAGPALPTLLQLLEKPGLPAVGRQWGPPHRAAVIRAVGLIGPEARAAVPALLSILQSNNYVLRTEVALALARIGPPAREALAARDAVSWASVTLLAARPGGNLATLPLVQVVMKTWVPGEDQTIEAVRQSVLFVDPDAAPRAGPRANVP
jgi:HEAT repeat protein